MRKLKSLEILEESLAKLPGIGNKTAERMAYKMLDFSDEDLKQISDSIKNLKTHLTKCEKCGMIIENNKCEICDDLDRNQKTILVVSYPKDVFSIENSGTYHGLYHVLNGEICLSKGVRVEDLNIAPLFERVNTQNIEEIIIATNPTLDGETTSLYLAKLLEKTNVKITRLAYGLQMGGSLDYVDPLTLSKSLEGRHKI